MDRRDLALLSEHLFQPGERWGWQYADPGPLQRLPEAEPRMKEPPVPNGEKVDPRPLISAYRIRWFLVMAVLFMIGSSFEHAQLFTALACLVLLAFIPWNWVLNRVSMASENWRYRRLRAERVAEHESECLEWRQKNIDFDRTEYVRWVNMDLWYPLKLHGNHTRVDVIGGQKSEWTAFLAVTCSGALAVGRRVLIIDMSEGDVAGPLVAMARNREIPTQVQSFPVDLEEAQLLEGLTADQVARMIAGLLDDMRPAHDAQMRLMDVDILELVTEALTDRPITFRRIHAGLTILDRGEHSRDLLTDDEVERLFDAAERIDGESMRAELRFARSTIKHLAQSPIGPKTSRAGGPWTANGLWVIKTSKDDHWDRELVDQLVVQSLLLQVHKLSAQKRSGIVVVAGVDHLSLKTLDTLTERASRAGLLLIFMFKDLRDQAKQLIGTSASATIIMKLGNTEQASDAADYIGRDYKFLVTATTEEHGQSDETNESESRGTNSSQADTRGQSHSRTAHHWLDSSRWFEWPTFTRGHENSQTLTMGESRDFSQGRSQSISTSAGQTVSRVYELTVEPTNIQHMEPMTFLLVEALAESLESWLAPSILISPSTPASAFTNWGNRSKGNCLGKAARKCLRTPTGRLTWKESRSRGRRDHAW